MPSAVVEEIRNCLSCSFADVYIVNLKMCVFCQRRLMKRQNVSDRKD